jgi:hypothetical protein
MLKLNLNRVAKSYKKHLDLHVWLFVIWRHLTLYTLALTTVKAKGAVFKNRHFHYWQKWIKMKHLWLYEISSQINILVNKINDYPFLSPRCFTVLNSYNFKISVLLERTWDCFCKSMHLFLDPETSLSFHLFHHLILYVFNISLAHLVTSY